MAQCPGASSHTGRFGGDDRQCSAGYSGAFAIFPGGRCCHQRSICRTAASRAAQHRSDGPAFPIRDLRLLSPIAPTEATVHGVVTLTSPLFIQDATGGVAIKGVQTQVPLQIGDEVEAKGFAQLRDFSPVLQNATVRLLWSHSSLAPVSVTTLMCLRENLIQRLSSLRDYWLTNPGSGGGLSVLSLEDGDQSFLVIAGGTAGAAAVRRVKKVSRLRLRGICTL